MKYKDLAEKWLKRGYSYRTGTREDFVREFGDYLDKREKYMKTDKYLSQRKRYE